MSSSENPDSTSSGGFIKSVMKAFSGSQRTPDSSTETSPTVDKSFREQSSDGLGNRATAFMESSGFMESSEKRVPERESRSPPIGAPENEINGLDADGNQVEKSSLLQSPDRDPSVMPRALGVGLNADFEIDLRGVSSKRSSQAFSVRSVSCGGDGGPGVVSVFSSVVSYKRGIR